MSSDTRFVHVSREFAIGGVRGTQIDFSIGHEAVGLEVKLATAVFKTAGLQRLHGQLEDYKREFDEDALIVLIFCEEEHLKNNTMLEKIEERIESHGAEATYVEIPAG